MTWPGIFTASNALSPSVHSKTVTNTQWGRARVQRTMGKQIYPFQTHFVITWPYSNQCLLSHFLGSVWEPRRKSPASLIIPQYESSKITVFVCGKKYDAKIWKFLRRRRQANTTDLELQTNLRWFEITLGQLLPVTKERISQLKVSWVKSRIAPFLQNNSFVST